MYDSANLVLMSMSLHLLPWKIDRVPIRDNLDDLAIDGDAISANRLDVSFEDAEGGVILEEVGGLLDTSGVVDCDNVERGVLAAVPAPQEVASDSSESINGHLKLCLYYTFPVSPAASHRRGLEGNDREKVVGGSLPGEWKGRS